MPIDPTNDLHTHRQMHHQQALEAYNQLKKQSRSLDITRGKPSVAQLDLANRILTLPGEDYLTEDGVDVRNYGGLDGLPAMKQLFADILQVAPQNVIVGGNSSLAMMYDASLQACQFGVVDDCDNASTRSPPWNNLATRKFICPTPGYDRHFLISAHLGFQLLAVDMTEEGPDMQQVEALVAKDATIKGIWCVPKYSNPTAACYSPETVQRLASMHTAATDFRIMWDNAYAEHHFTEHRPTLQNIAQCCEAANHPNRVLQFASTSKISHPGSGVAALASSDANIADAKTHLAVQSIGPDKVNQLRHLRLFGDLSGLRAHMEKHAALIKPKFAMVLAILQRDLGGLTLDGVPLAQWSQPSGGYFINLDIPEGKAKRTIQLASEAGVKLTPAGAPFPYGKDPRDRNIRIAPTYPPLQDIQQATEILTLCIKLAVSE